MLQVTIDLMGLLRAWYFGFASEMSLRKRVFGCEGKLTPKIQLSVDAVCISWPATQLIKGSDLFASTRTSIRLALWED